MSTHIYGVNLGGWLVLEKWMTPSLFQDISADDEYTFMKHSEAKKRITTHRDTFITEADFKWLHDHEVSLVRIPVGYWLFEAVDGFLPTVSYLDKAMIWAEKYEINVLINLHGAKGSQNGKDHSGKIGQAHWFTHKSNLMSTEELLLKIGQRYKNSPSLWGIELLNEPKVSHNYFTLLWFYRRMYRKLRSVLRPGTRIVYHDGFHAVLFSHSLWSRRSHPVYMDVHWYSFSALGKDAKWYLKTVAFYRQLLLKYVQLFQPIIIGEWSSVFPHPYLKDLSTNEQDELLRKNIAMQLAVYRHASAWTYWNYKHESGGMWNFRSLVEHQMLDLKKYRKHT